jgi:hypothetical protein
MAAETVCGACGTINQAGEDFCGSCGSYLDWESEPTAPEPETVVERAPVEKPPTTVVGRVKSAVGLAPAQTSENAAAGQERSVTEEGQLTQKPDPEAMPAQPVAAVQPGSATPKPRRRPTTAGDQPVQHGDLICGRCGAGNKPDRRFCRRCGQDLVEAEVAQLPWWRRALAKAQPRRPNAGARPKQRRSRRRIRSLALIVALLAVVAAIANEYRPSISSTYQAGVDRILNGEPLTPTRFRASSAARGHRARFVKDGYSNRYWAPARSDQAKGAWIEATFPQPTRLVRVVITPGAGGKEAQFQAQGRPTNMTVILTTGSGTTHKRIHLDDEPGPQNRWIGVDDVSRARFRIDSATVGDRPGSRIAVAEIRFFHRSR